MTLSLEKNALNSVKITEAPPVHEAKGSRHHYL